MARSGGSRGGARPGRRPAPRARAAKSSAPKPSARRAAPASDGRELTPRSFVLGAVPGTSPGVWIERFRDRHPSVAFELRSIPADDQARTLVNGEVDAALVRLPLDDDALHVIPLYEEVTVAVVPADSHLTAADELDLADLAGEIVLVPGDDVLRAVVPESVAPAFAAPADTAEAVATIAAGVGLVIVPFSLARLHARSDVASRPIRDAPTSRIGIAWPVDATTPDVEAFVGIVRGRTANSSR